jgi:L-ascorbate metabolism protein UlaG (beta-lactamase superfamily)
MPTDAQSLSSPPRWATSNFDGKRFHNLVPRRHGFWAVLRWMMNRQPGPWRGWVDAQPEPPPPRLVEGLRITYVNHSTFLLQIDGINILTDPMWSKRASPVQWLGPRRRRPPGIRMEDLPPINAILLSHDHYDHLDIPALRRLAQVHRPVIYTGLRNAQMLNKHGIDEVVELDWWESSTVFEKLQLTAVPAQHFSGRSPFDRDTRLWCGFVLQGRAGQIYFAGDTGMGPHFQQIAERFPKIDLALLPIGAFRPEWFMGEVHLSPDDAVRAHLILRAKLSVACHFGVFRLADDGQDEPVEALERMLGRTDLNGTEFVVMECGESREGRAG